MTTTVASGPLDVAAPAAVAAVAPSALLRTALIWRGEVMADRVARTARSITLGATARSTFVVPDLDLPPDFAIIRPGNRGYLLTLGARMRGTLCLDGHQRDVAEFVRRGGEGGVGDTGDPPTGASAFRATAIGGRDWGVIDLDPDGHHQLFFQFVPADAPLPKRRFEPELLLPALAFSIILHTVLLVATYTYEDEDDPLAYPGSAALTGRFLINRPKQEPPEPLPVAVTGEADDHGQRLAVNSATSGREGRSGGRGDLPRARGPAPPPRKGECWQGAFQACLASTADPTTCARVADEQCRPAPKVALLDDENRERLESVRALDLTAALGRYSGLPGRPRGGSAGQGRGTGTGFGDDAGGTGTTRGSSGDGPGGGGALDGDQLSRGRIDTGETRPASGRGGRGSGLKEKAVVATGAPSGELGGLSKEEIDKVVRSRQNLIRACYQRELDRTTGLGGKLVVSFTIAATGEVTRTKIDAGKSTLRSEAVEDCVTRQIGKLRFPAKGGGFVNYPFIFSQG